MIWPCVSMMTPEPDACCPPWPPNGPELESVLITVTTAGSTFLTVSITAEVELMVMLVTGGVVAEVGPEFGLARTGGAVGTTTGAASDTTAGARLTTT